MHPPPAKIPTLTILSHPQVSRVGERAKLWPAGEAEGEALLSRWQLDFAPPGGGEARPLDDPYLSRRPLHFTAARFGGIRLDCSRSGTRLVANEDWVSEDRVFLGVEVERGVVLVLAERLVLLLHNLAPDLDEKTPTFGLFGEASAMLRLRQEIGRRREDSRPLLVLGPTGAGKTSVARAIHAARSEESRPRLEIDAGETTPFESLPDLWEQARGGSLILSRPEMIPEELQTEILRHHEAEAENVQLIGVAAAELSRDFEERRSGPLVEALLANAVEVPELVHRRDDIGRLLFHFLSDELANLDALHRLDDPGPYAPAWCPVRLVGRLASYEWPENVRQLERVSQSLAKLYHGKAEIDLDL